MRMGGAVRKITMIQKASQESLNKSNGKAATETGAAEDRVTITYKDLIVEALAGGIDAVEAMVEKHQVSRSIVLRAAKEMESKYPDHSNGFVTWVKKNYGTPERGRSNPNVGEVRRYKAQKVGASAPFIRCPIEVLGVGKGGLVDVSFEEGRIVITPADDGE